MKCIEVRDVVKSFKTNSEEIKVLNGVNMTVDCNSIYSLIGSSGCGKTTLLSLILGMDKFQNGEIKIFKTPVKYEKTLMFSQLIGFMPQNSSVPMNLTIFEVLQYFSNLHMMDRKKFQYRFEMILELLNLPSSDTVIGKLSEGGKRRVSLAIAIIHDPKLLLLDEPTVGVDILLRDKIWTFLQEQTLKKKLTVLVTTHCLNEAEKSDRCGFLHKGTLVVENAPSKIKNQFNVPLLDNAFIKICTNQLKNSQIDDYDTAKIIEEENLNFEIKKERKILRSQVVKGLAIKEWHRIKRQFFDLMIIFLTSSTIIGVNYFLLGRFPNDLRIGIFMESKNWNSCENFQKNYSISKDLCQNADFSCEFLNYIKNTEKVFYDNYQQAFNDFKHGKNFGFIFIKNNFTKSLLKKVNLKESKTVEIFLDHSRGLFKSFLQMKIHEAFHEFMEDLAKRCNVKPYLLLSSFEAKDIKGEKVSFEMFKTLAINMISLAAFTPTMFFSLLLIFECRNEGIWNRTLLSGVKMTEIVFVYFIQSFIISVIVAIEIILFLKFVMDLNIGEHCWIIALMVFEIAQFGYLAGFQISITFKNLFLSACFLLIFLTLEMDATGIFWPLEGALEWSYPYVYTNPLTFPNLAFLFLINFSSSELTLQVYKLECINENETRFFENINCKLRTIRRGVNAIDVYADVKQDFDYALMNIELMLKSSSNQFNSVIINNTFEVCDSIDNMPPMFKFILPLLDRFGKFLHKCPFTTAEKELGMKNLELDTKLIPLIALSTMERGDYRCKTTFTYKENEVIFRSSVYMKIIQQSFKRKTTSKTD
ncbi:hypothetical protein PVAND_000089 [Polypedilum vanderplanki]|uniref:ABC transporter domain-containing protein n=1 Tax=Polypedilum vanderplanki TaxID=319348 RepID=A0A9J6BIZ4_POLVA|nr:hypothetical protein PVAND_000089 [Polypedilum vanderplanki]